MGRKSLVVFLGKKIHSVSILLNLKYNRLRVKSESSACGTGLRLYYPISLKGLKYFCIGDNVKIDYYGILEAWDSHNGVSFFPNISIGSNVSVGKCFHLGCINSVKICDDVLIGSNVMIIDHNHGMTDHSDLNTPPNKRILTSNGPIVIGKNVWIGENVSVLSGVVIGENTIIGANSVVTKSIPANCIACGVPAQIIKRIG